MIQNRAISRQRMFRWFLRYLLNYISIFLISVILSMMIYHENSKTTTDVLLSAYNDILSGAIQTIESSISRAQNSASNLMVDENILAISRADDSSLPNSIIPMNRARTLLRRTRAQLGEEFVSIFVFYPGNRYVLSNHFVSDDYRRDYGLTYEFEGLSAQDMYQLFTGDLSYSRFVLFPYTTLKSSYLLKSCPALPITVPLAGASDSYSYASLVFLLDAEWVEELFSLGFPEGHSGFTLLDQTNKPVLGDTAGFSEEDYYILTAGTSIAPYLTAKVAIHRSFISMSVSNMMKMIKIYVFSGAAGILLLSVFYAIHRLTSMSALVKIPESGERTPDSYKTPYNYLRDELTALSAIQDELKQKLLFAENAYASNLLVNACIRGIADREDLKNVSEILPESGRHFCVAALKIHPEYCASLALIDAESRFASGLNAITIHHTPSETVFIISAKDETAITLLAESADSIVSKFGRVGVSALHTSVFSIHTAYQQAHSALRQAADAAAVKIYEMKPDPAGAYLGLDKLSLLQNLILSGDSEKTAVFFADLIEHTADYVGIDRFQLLFTLRQLLVRIHQMHVSAKDAQPFPPFVSYESGGEGLMRLQVFAVELCARFRGWKRVEENKSVSAVLRVIESDFSNQNLNAEYIAGKTHFSVKYIYQIVKEHTQKTLGDIIEDTRLNFASELLRTTNKQIDEIASLSGYASVNTFYRLFKKKYGISPGEWRRQNATGSEMLPPD